MKIKYIGYIVFIIILLFAGLYGFYSVGNEAEEVFAEEELPVTENVPYENLFRKYAPEIGWPWELLAALCWEESHWNANAESASGAKGLMQLMPKTGRRFSLNDSTFLLPEENLRAGVQYIKHLQRTFSFITDSAENQHFVLASYNAGPAHIMDARRLAKRYGYSPYVWFDNTEYWLSQLNKPEVAEDSVVRYGSFSPAETVSHVKKVKYTYKRILRKTQN